MGLCGPVEAPTWGALPAPTTHIQRGLDRAKHGIAGDLVPLGHGDTLMNAPIACYPKPGRDGTRLDTAIKRSSRPSQFQPMGFIAVGTRLCTRPCKLLAGG